MISDSSTSGSTATVPTAVAASCCRMGLFKTLLRNA
jgi:hypothetical protein